MNDETLYKNNPLHGLGLKDMLIQLVDHYGFEILYAYLNINCFNSRATIESSVKFLKKTDWAREKVEIFYLYEYKNLPKASSEQFKLSPRDRIVPAHHTPGEPAELSLEDAERLREKRAKKVAERQNERGFNKPAKKQSGSYSSSWDDSRASSSGYSRPDSKPQTDNAPSKSDSGPSKSSADNPWGNWEK